MSKRRERSHETGLSNIDYRSKKDYENIKTFETWKVPKDFGTQGYERYKNSFSQNKTLFKPVLQINTQKDYVNDHPNPKYYNTAKFYVDNKITLKTKALFTNERVAQLDENFKGKEIFTGDSMQITDLVKQRKKLKKKQRESTTDRTKNLKDRIISDKAKQNKDTIQETQLVKIKAEKSDEDKANLDKVKEIILAIRRRYGNRNQIIKIFHQWAKENGQEITVKDMCDMINGFNIPINENEARTLLASVNERNNGSLNMDEFSQLINTDTESIIKHFLSCQNSVLSEHEQNSFRLGVNDNIRNVNRTIEINNLKDFIKKRLSIFAQKIKGEHGFSTFAQFRDAINKMTTNEQLTKENIVKDLFDMYKDDKDLLDVQKFGEKIYLKENVEPMSKAKEDLLALRVSDINAKIEEINDLQKNFKGINDKFYAKKNYLNQQIYNKKNIENAEFEDEKKHYTYYSPTIIKKFSGKLCEEINSTVPSLPWIHKVFDRRREHHEELNKVEDSFSPQQIKLNEQFGKTRFGANPLFYKTERILCGKQGDPTFLSEKERFKHQGTGSIGTEEKLNKLQLLKGRAMQIKSLEDANKERIAFNDFLKTNKEKVTMYKKSRTQFDYEEKVHNNNLFFE